MAKKGLSAALYVGGCFREVTALSPKASAALAKITDEEWVLIILELGRYALSVSRGLYWRTDNHFELPDGETFDSIVSKAIESIFTGDRNWDPDQDPDLKKYLKAVIDSHLNHLATSKDNTLLVLVPASDSEGEVPLEVLPANGM